MTKIDIIIAAIIGEIIGLFGLSILKNLGIEKDVLYLAVPIILPVLSVAGLLVAHLLSKKVFVIWQLAKFVLVGALNTFVDLGVLNILILISQVAGGPLYSVFKGISFIVAVINSYFWNKLWVFSARIGEIKKEKEFFQFLAVSVIGFVINVGTATLIVVIGPRFGMTLKLWANLAAIIAAFAGMSWNFVGYKFIVFKK